MLQANELMIGDWVYNKHHGKNIRLTPYDFFTHTHDESGEQRLSPFPKPTSGMDLEPIPLTAEILARMGFAIEEEPKYDDTYTEDEYTATMKCVDSRKCEVEIEYNTYWKKLRAFKYDPRNRLGSTRIETQVEYVHGLQHVMRLCGIEENFVI